jgi:hypothetical protein
MSVSNPQSNPTNNSSIREEELRREVISTIRNSPAFNKATGLYADPKDLINVVVDLITTHIDQILSEVDWIIGEDISQDLIDKWKGDEAAGAMNFLLAEQRKRLKQTIKHFRGNHEVL